MKIMNIFMIKYVIFILTQHFTIEGTHPPPRFQMGLKENGFFGGVLSQYLRRQRHLLLTEQINKRSPPAKYE